MDLCPGSKFSATDDQKDKFVNSFTIVHIFELQNQLKSCVMKVKFLVRQHTGSSEIGREG